MEENSPNRLRIMIVEDDVATARNMENMLKRRGFTVTGIANSGVEARELIQQERADLVLLDINLQGEVCGLELAYHFRQDYGISAIFITGYSEDTLIEQARQAKPAGFIRKPFSDIELAAVVESVTERCLSRERLQTHLPGLEAVASQLNQAVITSDLDGQVVMINHPAESLTGWTRQDALNARLREVVQIENEQTENNSGDSRVVFLSQKNGKKIRVEERSSPVRSNDGEVIGLVSVLESLDDSGEAALHEEGNAPMPMARSAALEKVATLAKSSSFRSLLGPKARTAMAGRQHRSEVKSDAQPLFKTASPLIEELGDPLINFGSDGTISYANPEALSTFGTQGPLIGTAFKDCFPPDVFENNEEDFYRPLIDGRRHKFDFQDTEKGKWFEVRLYRTNDGVLALFHDISQTKIDEAEGIRQQRLEGLGLLARGFSHDFNNNLTTITGNLSLAREKYLDDEELQNMLNEAQGAANRATNLVQQLMTFASGGRPIREQIRVPDLIRGVLSEHRDKHPLIRYQFQGNNPDLTAYIDPAQLNRLIENLVNNSEHAMKEEGGVLVIRCGKVTPEEVKRYVGGRSPSDEDHLLIEAIDTGPGIDEATLAQVFDPYFTTRKLDNATGIGLTVCESIAKAHGGFIFLQSKIGKGTIATFCCPMGDILFQTESELEETTSLKKAVPPLFPGSQSPLPEEPTNTGPARILILEDDVPIMRLMAATLTRAGHEVVETIEGRETLVAFQEAKEKGEPFDLVISDLTIEQGMGGVETMQKLREMDPNVLAIVSSGYSDAAAMSNPTAFGFKAVLPKPYAPSELRDLTARVLAAREKG